METVFAPGIIVPLRPLRPFFGSAPAPELEQIRGTRVLVADDSASNRFVLREMLRSLGCRSVEVADATQALDALRKARDEGDAFRLAILDQIMPGMNGIEVTRRLRDISPETRVLAMTVHEDEDMLREMLRAGAYGYIIKPFDPTNLRASVEMALYFDGTPRRERRAKARTRARQARTPTVRPTMLGAFKGTTSRSFDPSPRAPVGKFEDH
jgi:two-component system response regulator (stage 0 sporulation protein F)